MIIKLLFQVLIDLLESLFFFVELPPMPEQVTNALDMLLEYMAAAMSLVWLVVPRDLVIVVLPIILILDNFDKVYTVVMWILRKIPFLGMQ